MSDHKFVELFDGHKSFSFLSFSFISFCFHAFGEEREFELYFKHLPLRRGFSLATHELNLKFGIAAFLASEAIVLHARAKARMGTNTLIPAVFLSGRFYEKSPRHKHNRKHISIALGPV